MLHAINVVRSRVGEPALSGVLWLAGGVTIQATIGILTLLDQAPLDLALTHQAMAMVVLTLATLHAERVTPPPSPAPSRR
jgi:cytochrome c oxidase assembly protein subunit 15